MLLLLVTVLILGLQIAAGCDMDQTRHGCRIQSRVCSCGFGCKSEYRYLTMKDCQDSLKGKRTDVCFNQPCMNGGSCIQISQFPGYRCRCEGSGYYGQRCHISCPLPGTHVRGAFPYECIVI
ncbi:Cadherin-N [Carabus blaptoides fortunei]